MAEDKYIRYGDKTMPLGDLTLEQAKEVMARHFPELADPKIETKKEGDRTIYVFGKKAGTKGNDLSRVCGRLAKLKPAPAISRQALAWATALTSTAPAELKGDVNALAHELQHGATIVASAREQLLDLAPQIELSGGVLL